MQLPENPARARLDAVAARWGLNAFQLKIIALLTMTIDHIGEFLGGPLPIPFAFRIIGRIAAPIFVFLVAWGFYYTHNRRRYMLRLYLWGAGMCLANWWVARLCAPWTDEPIANGIFQTLFYIVYYLYWLEEMRGAWGARRWKRCLAGGGALVLPFLLLPLRGWVYALARGVPALNAHDGILFVRNGLLPALLPSPLTVEGSVLVILMGVAFYYLRNSPVRLTVFYTALSLFLLAASYQGWQILALPFLLLYNHQKGRGMKYLFYAYYPAHIYVLYVLGAVLSVRWLRG